MFSETEKYTTISVSLVISVSSKPVRLWISGKEITCNKSQKWGAKLFYFPCVNLCQLSFNVRVTGQIGPYRITPMHYERQYSKLQHLPLPLQGGFCSIQQFLWESFFPDISSLSHSSFFLWLVFFFSFFRLCHGTSKPTPHTLLSFFILFVPCSCWSKTAFEAPEEAERFLSLFVCIRSVCVF